MNMNKYVNLKWAVVENYKVIFERFGRNDNTCQDDSIKQIQFQPEERP